MHPSRGERCRRGRAATPRGRRRGWRLPRALSAQGPLRLIGTDAAYNLLTGWPKYGPQLLEFHAAHKAEIDPILTDLVAEVKAARTGSGVHLWRLIGGWRRPAVRLVHRQVAAHATNEDRTRAAIAHISDRTTFKFL